MLLGWMVSVGHHLGRYSGCLGVQSPLSTTSSINWVCSSDSVHGCHVTKNVLTKRQEIYFHDIIIIIMNYNKQNYLPNTLNRNNAFKI